ncbi:hypothetical protein Tco_1194763 [Tanacetum coccineum]
MDFSADNKKRRLPKSQVFPDDGVVDPTRPDFGNVSHHEFPGKLRLELSPDTCKSFSFNMPTEDTNEENEGHPSCQLNLTLASSVSQINPCQGNDTIPQSFKDIGKPPSENVPSNPKLTNNAASAAPTYSCPDSC